MQHHHQYLDGLTWPLLTVNASAWVTGVFDTLWQHVPGPTAIYMVISALFMLFQMSDKLGLLDKFKRRERLSDAPETPPEHS